MVTSAVQRARFLAPGDKLGKHELIRQIAVGGMAELYLARTVGLEGFEKLVVLKRILPQFADNASFVNMFLNEARLAATLHHPNIAQVFDIGQDGTDYFFSMEYVHGEDLGRLFATATDSGVPLSLDAALTLVAGLCAGLHYAHDKAGPDGKPLHVVHRDVSPSNVLVSYDGAVKLVDFGIARAGSNPSTTRGGLKGKIAYMSPEQCRGKVTLDRRSDVFSIGTILYELTTGRLPFTDETEYGILNQIVNRDAEPPSTIVPNFSPALEAIVMRALARDPDQRYPTALELQKDVEDYAHENRLRVSPLVLARLMGTLFPTRLEEWDHARAQGAFFVEQHVVRTLIESGKGDGSGQVRPDGLGPFEDDSSITTGGGSATGTDTIVGPPPVEETHSTTSLRPLPGLPPSHPGPGQRPSQMSIPKIHPVAPRASQTAMGPPPPRPSQAAMGPAPMGQPATRPSQAALAVPAAPAAMPVQRASSPAIAAQRASSPVFVPDPGYLPSEPQLARASTPPPTQSFSEPPQPGRLPTPVPGRLPTPIPGMPGAVPIVVAPVAPIPPSGPQVPSLGALASGYAVSGPQSLVYPVAGMVDVTERIRARAPDLRGETAIIQVSRSSRTPVIIVTATAVVAAAVAMFIVFGGNKKDVAAAGSQDDPKPAAGSSEPKQDPANAVQPDPTKADGDSAKDPAKADGEPTKTDGEPTKADGEPTKTDGEPTKADGEPAKDPTKTDGEPSKTDSAPPDPKSPKKPKIVRQPPKAPKKPPNLVTVPKKDPKKPDPPATKEQQWTPDSPFLPVRPADKK